MKLEYNRNRRWLCCQLRKNLEFPGKFVGADDTAGPNISGQLAVDF